VQSEIFKWTGRTDILDGCDPSGTRSFVPNQKFDIVQNVCQKRRIS
jgi:hypothetical protein